MEQDDKFKFTKMMTDRKLDIFTKKDINISPIISINLWNYNFMMLIRQFRFSFGFLLLVRR